MQSREELLDRIAQLEDLLGLTAALPISGLLQRRGIARQDSKILGMLVRRPFVPNEAIYDALYGALHESKRPEKYSTRTSIKRIRAALSDLGIEISNVYGEGYFLDQQNKQKLLKNFPELAWKQERLAA